MNRSIVTLTRRDVSGPLGKTLVRVENTACDGLTQTDNALDHTQTGKLIDARRDQFVSYAFNKARAGLESENLSDAREYLRLIVTALYRARITDHLVDEHIFEQALDSMGGANEAFRQIMGICEETLMQRPEPEAA